MKKSLSIFIAFLLVPAAGLSADVRVSWKEILKTLNAPFAPPATASRYWSGLQEDIVQTNRKELETISKAWVQNSKSMKFKDRQAERGARNRFFHRRISALNDKTFLGLENAGVGTVSRVGVANKILARVAANPVAAKESTLNYRQGQNIGFCFGRALMIHSELLKHGIKQHELVKIFSIGDLLVEKQLWKFHVAVAVQSKEGGYIVIDPLHDKPLPYKPWIAHNVAYGVKHPNSRVRFYLTDPRKFLPSFGQYDQKQLMHAALKDYFRDLRPFL